MTKSRTDAVFAFTPDAAAAPRICFHAGRVGLASLFILGGINKLAGQGPSIAMMEAAGLPAPSLLIWLVIAVELGFGLLVAGGGLVAGGRAVAPAAIALAAHTVAVNILLHDFWAFEGERARLEISLFFKNMAVIGGLVMVAGLYGARRNE